jgi:hypothetical protein
MDAEQRPPSRRDRVVRATCVALTSFALVLLAGAASRYQPEVDGSHRVELAEEPLPAPVPEDPRGREDGGGKNYDAIQKGSFMDWYRVSLLIPFSTWHTHPQNLKHPGGRVKGRE